MSDTKYSPGDRVSFECDGYEEKFFGVVMRPSLYRNGEPLIKPDKPLSPKMRIKNVQKVSQQ